jgi:4-phospho-D-threonate 3-dehydrogenase / 4-phospho-D-erythronate 3-dehydrogenase
MHSTLPIVGITMGDPAGIGPEVIVKALADNRIHKVCRPIVIGDAAVMCQAVEMTASSMKVNPVGEVGKARFERGAMDVLDLANVDMAKLELGKVLAMAGEAAFAAIKKAIELAMGGHIDATCTAPINKESLNAAGHKYAGHTEIYADLTGTKDYAMLLVEGTLRVVHVTTHVQLRNACDMVTRHRVLVTIKLAHDACKNFGIEKPRIGVAALNPHAGEAGLFGWEEDRHIRPAVEDAVKLGIGADGPVPADTLFSKAAGGLYDACVAMYHDQGHIPLKLAGFKWDDRTKSMAQVSGVNITLGLPVIRTSVDHGTAFDKAGKGVAVADSMILAIEYAARMAAKRGAV